MTGYAALALLENAQNYLHVSFGVIQLKPNTSIYLCETDKSSYPYKFQVGVCEFVNSPYDMFTISDVMYPLVGMFHEVCGHGGQFVYEFNKETSLSKVLALNYYACNGSLNYYGMQNDLPTDQYFKQPHEIAAQYAGLYCCYQFLCDQFDTQTANTMICAYVNDRIQNGSEFISAGRPYSSVKSILRDFDHTFQRSVSAHRVYERNPNQPDILLTYLARGGSPSIPLQIETCANGLKQDYQMAALYIILFIINNIKLYT